ncbi:MAG: Sugar lactone lactonase YvrE [Bradyrhizobium sp.]|nr:Sugar lactone lactonase YvrE [Bradyrhizobium sp.]
MTDLANPEHQTEHHGGALLPVPHRVVAIWPARAFLENLAVGSNGAVFVTVYSHNRIDRYDPASGETGVFAELPVPPMGIAIDDHGTAWVSAGVIFEGPGSVWAIGRNGTVKKWCDLPDAKFVNGCTLHPDGKRLLICESLSGRILAVDMAQPDRWSIWAEDALLSPGQSPYPGANGIKIHDGWAWITVSGTALLVRVAIGADGASGVAETVERNMLGDDFAIAASGAVYVTTHPAHSVVRIEASGVRTTIAGPEHGVVGSTACAFGRAPGDEHALYVTTDGGFLIPYGDAVQDAKLVRLEVGESGV